MNKKQKEVKNFKKHKTIKSKIKENLFNINKNSRERKIMEQSIKKKGPNKLWNMLKNKLQKNRIQMSKIHPQNINKKVYRKKKEIKNLSNIKIMVEN